MSSSTSWQDRRAELLQQACDGISGLVREGLRIGRAIKRIAREYNAAELGNGQRLKLSKGTLERIWYRWNQRRDPSVFKLKHAGSRPVVDGLLLRLVVEYCLQTGASLGEAIERIGPKGAKFSVSVKDIYGVIPKRALDALSQSQRQLSRQRAKIEAKFMRSDAKWRKRFLKQRAEFERRLLHKDAELQVRLLRHREVLQRKFLEADARAIRRREQIQRKFLSNALRST